MDQLDIASEVERIRKTSQAEMAQDDVPVDIMTPTLDGSHDQNVDLQNLAAEEFTPIVSQEEGEGTPNMEELPPEPEPEPEPVDSQVEIAISADDLSASIFVTPALYGGKEATVDQVVEVLRASGVVFGVAIMTIRRVISQNLYSQWVEVAVGKKPIDGEDGKIIIHKMPSEMAGPQVNEDGTVNYKELGVVDNVIAGDVLATATAPTDGEPGTSVRGTDLTQRTGQPARLPWGNGTHIMEDGLTLVAATNGNLSMVNGMFFVAEVFEIKGNIDTSTGNIDFVGSVRVTGDVRSGFSIISGGDIKVNGVVEGATLQAEGNISVDSGINGMGNGKIVARGELKSKFIESCEVQTGGSLFAESIINSDVKCDGDLIMTKGKGSLIGGTALVAGNLTAINVGSYSNIATSVTLGYTSLLTEKIGEARENLARIEGDILKLDQAILYLNDLYMKKAITPQRYEMLKQSIYSRNYKAEELERTKIELMAMEEKFNQPTRSVLKCTGAIFPGVRVNISNYIYRVTNELYKSMLYLGEDGIVVGQGS